MIEIYIHIMESQREAKPPLYNQFPLSFEGEGDKGGEVDTLVNIVICRVGKLLGIISPE